MDRALDSEREARTRLRPLKRQAEAAELHERLARQIDEAGWTLAADAARAAGSALADAAAEPETEPDAAAADRETAEAALAARGSEREPLSSRFYAARSAAERAA